jgi:hypothetical protein
MFAADQSGRAGAFQLPDRWMSSKKPSAEDFCERFDDSFCTARLGRFFFARKMVYCREFGPPARSAPMFGPDRFGASIAPSLRLRLHPVFLVMPKVRSDIANAVVEIIDRNAAATLSPSDASAIFAVFPHDLADAFVAVGNGRLDVARQGEILGQDLWSPSSQSTAPQLQRPLR